MRHKNRRLSKFFSLNYHPECFSECESLPGTWILCLSKKLQDTELSQYLYIMAKRDSRLAKVKIKIEEDLSDNASEYFKIVELPNLKRNKDNTFYFLIFSQNRVVMFCLLLDSFKLDILKIVKQRIEPGLDLVYSPQKKLFFVPTEEFLEIWDRTFSVKVFSIQLADTIKGFLVIPDSPFVALYDDNRCSLIPATTSSTSIDCE